MRLSERMFECLRLAAHTEIKHSCFPLFCLILNSISKMQHRENSRRVFCLHSCWLSKTFSHSISHMFQSLSFLSTPPEMCRHRIQFMKLFRIWQHDKTRWRRSLQDSRINYKDFRWVGLNVMTMTHRDWHMNDLPMSNQCVIWSFFA